MSRGGNIQESASLHNQNYFVSASLNVLFKIKIMAMINPNDSHNYHDNIEYY